MPKRSDPFVHLHVHSDYSMLDGMSSVDNIVQRVVDDRAPAVAITDHGSMGGTVKLFKHARSAGIKAIPGMEAYHVPDRSEKGKVGEGKANYHLTLLGVSDAGYRNLMVVTTRGYTEGKYSKWARVDNEVLAEHSEGIVATTGCLGSMVNQALLEGDRDRALRLAAEHRDIFGRDRYFVELQNHHIPDQLRIMGDQLWLADKLGVGLVATNDSHYTDESDAHRHDALLCMQTGSLLDEEDRFKFASDENWIRTSEQMRELFPDEDFPGACDNTLAIAEMAELSHPTDCEPSIPEFPLPESAEGSASHLRSITYKGAQSLYGDGDGSIPQRVRERLDHELDIICGMGFADYFLILSDIIMHSKSRGAIFGPGRGSAAGSAVSYCMGITTVDPIQYGLFFERFLNPGRVGSMPDIDVDFEDGDSRTGARMYAARKYGDDKVANIATYGVLKPRASIKGAARVLGMAPSSADRLTKLYPPDILQVAIPLREAVQSDRSQVPEGWLDHWDGGRHFRAALAQDSEARKVVELATELEGTIEKVGIHAAGTVISTCPIRERSPCREPGDDGLLVTQYNGEDLESIGLLKFDFLVINNLKTIRRTVELVRSDLGKQIDIERVPLDDPKVYRMLSNGDTDGVFQMESDGIKDLIRKLRPTEFMDLAAIVALYRPGPMGSNVHNEYADRKNGRSPKTAIHPEMLDILDETHGLVVYQEEVMSLAMHFAGYSAIDADNFRKAMGKKKADVMEAQKGQFVEGCVTNGYQRPFAEQLWGIIEPFSGYAFNKCVSDRTRVRMADNEPVTARELLDRHNDNEELWVQSMWPDGEIRPHRVSKVVRTGYRRVVRLRTQGGRTIEATPDHRLLTTRGYLKVEDMGIGDDELIVGDKITTPRQSEASRQNIQGWNAQGIVTDAAREARSDNMRRWNNEGGLAREEQNGRTAARMREYQETLTFEDRSRHQRAIDATTDRGARVAAAMRLRLEELRETDPEFNERERQTGRETAARAYATGPGFGHTCVASNGMVCDSRNELAMAEHLIELGIPFEIHKRMPNGSRCDFYFHGIYWEMDGLDRHISWFEQRYGDLPFVVVTPEDFKERVSDVLGLDHARNGDLVISIEDAGKRPTIDIEMESDGPKNYLTWKGIVSHNSHAVSYAMVGYWTAYLKANYPVQWAAACIDSMKRERIPAQVEAAREQGIEVYAPDVNRSTASTSTTSEAIWLGLSGMASFGGNAVSHVLSERSANGPYKNLGDFLLRTRGNGVNRPAVESMIHGGAFDGLHSSRRAMAENLKEMVDVASHLAKQSSADDGDSLFSLDSDDCMMSSLDMYDLDAANDYSTEERARLERGVLGFYVGQHPFTAMEPKIDGAVERGLIPSSAVPAGDTSLQDGQEGAQVYGVVSGLAVTKKSRSGKPYSKFALETGNGASTQVFLFGTALDKSAQGRLAVCHGRMRDDSDDSGDFAQLVLRASTCDMVDLQSIGDTKPSLSVVDGGLAGPVSGPGGSAQSPPRIPAIGERAQPERRALDDSPREYIFYVDTEEDLAALVGALRSYGEGSMPVAVSFRGETTRHEELMFDLDSDKVDQIVLEHGIRVEGASLRG